MDNTDMTISRQTENFEENIQMPGLAGQSRDYLIIVSAHVSYQQEERQLARALGVPLLACTRQAAPETGPEVLVWRFIQFTTAQIPGTDMPNYLYQTQ